MINRTTFLVRLLCLQGSVTDFDNYRLSAAEMVRQLFMLQKEMLIYFVEKLFDAIFFCICYIYTIIVFITNVLYMCII